ncbi:MAG: DUF1559 domain-containing protein [Pirellulaceae bacterium]|nr:DUF1559 domain-containing protein [Pirellulaceae bacterium]
MRCCDWFSVGFNGLLLFFLSLSAAISSEPLTEAPFTITTREVSQDPQASDELNQLMQRKEDLLKDFGRLMAETDREPALQILKQIVAIHLQARDLALASKEDELADQFGKVYLSDGEFLINQLFDVAKFQESAEAARELEQFLQPAAPSVAASPKQAWFRYHAKMMDLIAEATPKQQSAFMQAHKLFAEASEIAEADPAAATRLYAEGLKTTTSIVGDQFPYIFVRLGQYARLLWSQNQLADARVAYERAVASCESTIGRNFEFVELAFNLGRVCEQMQDVAAAEKYYRQTAATEAALHGVMHPGHAETLQFLARLFQNSGQEKKLAELQLELRAADAFHAVLSRIPAQAFAAATVEPNAMTRNATLEHLPFELIEAWGIEDLGLNPLSVTAAAGFLSSGDNPDQPEFGLVFRVVSDSSWVQPWRDPGFATAETHASGLKIFQFNEGQERIASVEFDDGTIVIGSRSAVLQCMVGESSQVLSELLLMQRAAGHLHAAVDAALVRTQLNTMLNELPPLPPELAGLRQLPDQLQTVQVTLQLNSDMKLAVSVQAVDDDAAAAVAELINTSLGMAREQIESQLANSLVGSSQMGSSQIMASATLMYARRILGSLLRQVSPEVSSSHLSLQMNLADHRFVGPFITAILLPAIQAARSAAQRLEQSNNAKLIGLAVLNYESANARFPARFKASPNGKPLLSWRVMILPYLDENELFNKFRLDEPWDSPHNLPLAAEMPTVFRDRFVADPNRTCIVAAAAKGAVFEGADGIRIRDITDGMSNTLMFVECDPSMAVVWTQPEDLRFDSENPSNGLGSRRDGGFIAAFCDGSTRIISASTDPSILRRLVLRADGEVIPEY